MKLDTKVETYLLNHGIKPSVQRTAIMQYLLTHRTHPSVDEIYKKLHPTIHTLSKTTVYNTLSLLAKNGVALELNIDSICSHFDADTSRHAHFYCTSCGKITDIFPHQMPIIERIEEELPEGVVAEEMQLSFKGICVDCKKKQGKN